MSGKFLVSWIAVLVAGWGLFSAQGWGQVVARVNGDAITSDEFETRYHLTVFPGKDQERSKDVTKWQILYSLIGERLLREEAVRRHVDLEPRMRRSIARAEAMFVRDKLYRDAVRARVTVTESEIRDRYERDLHEMEFTYLFSPDSVEAWGWSSLLEAGLSFDTLLVAHASTTIKEGRVDALDPGLRSALQTISPGSVPRPLRGHDGWYLVRRAPSRTTIASREDFASRRGGITQELRLEKEGAAVRALVTSLWKQHRAVLEDSVVRWLGQRLWEELKRQARIDTSSWLSISPERFEALGLEGSRFTVFARLSGPTGPDSLSFTDALELLASRGIRCPREDVNTFPGLFPTILHEMLDIWMVTREGYRRGLERSSDVTRDMEQWMSAGMAQAVLDVDWEAFLANEDSLWTFYVRNSGLFGPPMLVRLYEFESRDTAIVSNFWQEWRSGTTMEAFASRWKTQCGENGRVGESDWFPVTERGLVGRMAFRMSVGDVAGPVPISDGVLIFQLREKRLPNDTCLGSFGDLRERLAGPRHEMVRARRGHDLLVRLAARAQITIDTQVFESLDVTPLQMFTIRHLGFGGRIPAAPSIAPWYESVLEGLSKSRLQP